METVARLLEKGVVIPNPLTVDIGPEVDPERVSGAGVVIHPGCRIRGAATVVSAGVKLGAEGPVTLDDCLLGPDVDLKGGSFSRSVLLAGANMGPGAQVREGCLLEEEANGAHCVGLKQTILLPFVTLGSLVNFCDCLMAGGTSRRDHRRSAAPTCTSTSRPTATRRRRRSSATCRAASCSTSRASSSAARAAP